MVMEWDSFAETTLDSDKVLLIGQRLLVEFNNIVHIGVSSCLV